MAVCVTQNIVPSSALQRELKKKKKELQEKAMKGDEGEVSTPGERGMLLLRPLLTHRRCH